MVYLKSGLISLAAAAAFLLIDITVLSLAPMYRWAGACAVFVIAALLVWMLPSKKWSDGRGRGKMFSDNEYAGDVDISVVGSKLQPKKASSVFSDNTVGGTTKIKIKNSEL